MKKSILGLILLGSLLSSCTNETKTNSKQEEKTKKNCYLTIDEKQSKLNWTAFKTTDKLAVNGSFDQFNIHSNSTNEDITDLIKSTKFTINTSSINSGNEGRDAKLVEFFFGTLTDSETITGKVEYVKENNVIFKLSFNGQTMSVPFEYNFLHKNLTIKGVIDVNKFHGKKAIDKLNEACNDKHKGKDGISKTWPEVLVAFTTKIETKCK